MLFMGYMQCLTNEKVGAGNVKTKKNIASANNAKIFVTFLNAYTHFMFSFTNKKFIGV